MLIYRDYQSALVAGIKDAWTRGDKNPLAVLPTGGGKTVVFSGLLSEEPGASCAIAHRQELVGQMSLALARCQVVHRIIAPASVIRRIVQAHVIELGRTYYSPGAKCAVAGVDTLLNKTDELAAWLPTVKLWVVDEGHHVVRDNKWGKAVAMFPHARGLGVTATPVRASGEGLGRHADGVFDCLVEGPGMRELIRTGWLTDYRIFAPPSDLRLDDVPVSTTTGDYNPVKLRAAVHKSHIVGDVVAHYLRIAPGKLGVCFASDVETATDIARQFVTAGVSAEMVSAKTPDVDRANIMRRYRARQIMMLVNVDLFGEGFDLPAIEVISMARPTQSYGLYCQQFGRALRPMDGKDRAIIIDHVGNTLRHGLPDMPRAWSLNRRERRSRGQADDVPAIRACLNVECMQIYERVLVVCPFCGAKPEPASRSAPEFVDGDLTELDPAVLRRMRAEVARVDMPADQYRAELGAKHCPRVAIAPHVRRHVQRQDAQRQLRDAMALWAGVGRARGLGDAEMYRRFYRDFGVDALTAQALDSKDALTLLDRITLATQGGFS